MAAVALRLPGRATDGPRGGGGRRRAVHRRRATEGHSPPVLIQIPAQPQSKFQYNGFLVVGFQLIKNNATLVLDLK